MKKKQNKCAGFSCMRYVLLGAVSLFCGLAKAQECKILEMEYYARPLFALSRFYEDCNARKYEAEATWSFSVLQGGKETMFERLTPQKASFEVETNPDYVYDCSTKRYHAADSQVCIQYSFYANADALIIKIGIGRLRTLPSTEAATFTWVSFANDSGPKTERRLLCSLSSTT